MSPSSGTAAGAIIDGTIAGVSSVQSFHGVQSIRTESTTNGMTITVAGTTVSAPVDTTGHFTLHGVPAGDIQLQISANGINAMVSITGVAQDEHIQLSLRLNGSSLDIDENERETPDNRVEIEGRITAVDLSAQTLTIANTIVTVPSGTPIRHGDTVLLFADLKVGDLVEIHGTKSGTAVTATSVNDQTSMGSGTPGDNHGGTPGDDHGSTPGNDNGGKPGDDHGNGDNNHSDMDVKGALSALGGTCPTISFSIGSTAVVTNGSTEFKDTTCAALANGTRVEVKGTRQSNGSVLASRVQKDS